MSKRIGLLTLPLHTNYGGILQAVALYRILDSELGQQVFFLERASSPAASSRLHKATVGFLASLAFLPSLRNGLAAIARLVPSQLAKTLLRKTDAALKARRALGHRPFLDRYLPQRSGKLTSTQEMAAAVQRLGLDTLVVGSDQVWRLEYLPRGAEGDFFFGFAPTPEIRKISYAASFGQSVWTYPAHTAQTRALLAQFHAVSVREISGLDICAKALDRHDAFHTIDPTLLVDLQVYIDMAAPRRAKPGPILLSYVLDEGPDRATLRSRVQQTLGPGYSHRSLTLDAASMSLDVPGWLRAFIDADFVLTDSFHGVAFSIIFRKNFIAIVNHDRGADRFTSLLSKVGLEHRLVYDASDRTLEDLAATPIDYEQVDRRLVDLRRSSLSFLREALQ